MPFVCMQRMWDEDKMEIEHIGNNRIRCALTEEEIRQLGFDIDEIIGNSETTQQFMRTVLGLVEEHEHISAENISPMVKAELLQNHSMAITFGSEKDFSFRDLIETVHQIMSQINQADQEEAEGQHREEEEDRQEVPEPMICALRFPGFEDMRRMSQVCFPGRMPKSSAYKLDDSYYLVLDFAGFSREEMRPFIFGAVEYDDAHYSEAGQIAHIEEHGVCIIKNQAIETLMQL